MERSTSSSSFLNNYENMINILSLESKFSIKPEKETSLEQNLLWRRRQSLYKIINSSSTSLDSLTSNFSSDDKNMNIENKYKYQFECPNSMSLSYNNKNINSTVNEKLSQLRKQFE